MTDIQEPARDDERTCPGCGMTNRAAARFCAACGAVLGAPLCSSCRHELPVGGLFCDNCGTAVETKPDRTLPDRTLVGIATETANPKLSDRYLLGRLLGEGATKRVHHGIDEHLGRDVAIAVVKTEELDSDALLRVRREVRALVELSGDPCIVTVFDAVETPDAEYIVTEYLPGGDLQTWLERHPGPCDPAFAVRVGIDVAKALERTHGLEIVHRDVKPANVWLEAGGQARLGDFGLALAARTDSARITGEGALLGTVEYMSPEAAISGEVGPSADLYGLGALLYRMTTGRPPFTSDFPANVVHQHVATPPEPPSRIASLPGALEALILALLEKHPSDRPISAAEVRKILEEIADDPTAAVAVPGLRLGHGLVGRSDDLDRCREVLESAVMRVSRVLLVEGEAGIGKTRLMQELSAHARARGIRVVWSRGHEGPGVPPYWPWQQILRECLSAPGPVLAAALTTLRPDLDFVTDSVGARPEGDQDRGPDHFRLANDVTAVVRATATDAPLLIVLDDLHWSDPSSLQLLSFLARELGDARVLVAATYRDDELGRLDPLARIVADLSRNPATELLTLKGLDEEATGVLVEELCGGVPPVGLMNQVLTRSGGNPFYVAEMVRHATSDPQRWERAHSGASTGSLVTPRSLLEFVGRRLDNLSSPCNEVLAVAAVAGVTFDAETIRSVSGLDHARLLDLLEEAKAAGIVAESADGGDRYEFVRPLVRDTLYESIGHAGRIRLHKKIGLALESRHALNRTLYVDEIAHHFAEGARGGDIEKAMDYCRLAGHTALAAGDTAKSVAHFERALRVCDQGRCDDTVRCDVLIELGEARSMADDLVEARPVLSEAIQLAQTLGLPRRAARATLAYCRLWPELWRVDTDVVLLLERALAGLPDTDDPLRACLTARLAQELARSRLEPSPDSMADQAIAMARRCGDRHALARALLAGLYCSWPSNPRTRLAATEEIRVLAESVDDVDLCAHAAVLAGASRAALGELSEATNDHRRLREILHQNDRPAHRATLFIADASALAVAGDLQRAVAFSATAGELARRQGMVALSSVQLHQWIALAVERGQLEEIADLIHHGTARNGPQPFWQALSAYLRAAVGDTNLAAGLLETLLTNGLPRLRGALDHLYLESLLAELAAAAGDRESAAALLDVLMPHDGEWVTAGPIPVVRGPVARWLGILAATAGQYEEAFDHFGHAVSAEARFSVPAIATTTRWWHGKAQVGAGLDLEGGVRVRDAERAMRDKDRSPPPTPNFLKFRRREED